MSHNPVMDTAYLFKDGVVKIVSIGAYTHPDADVTAARNSLARLAKEHSCLEKWYHFQPNWSFRCISGASGLIYLNKTTVLSLCFYVIFCCAFSRSSCLGLAYIWKNGEMLVERSPKHPDV